MRAVLLPALHESPPPSPQLKPREVENWAIAAQTPSATRGDKAFHPCCPPHRASRDRECDPQSPRGLRPHQRGHPHGRSGREWFAANPQEPPQTRSGCRGCPKRLRCASRVFSCNSLCRFFDRIPRHLGRKDFHLLNGGSLHQQVGGRSHQCRCDAACQMGLTSTLVRERIEDPKRCRTHANTKPRRRGGFLLHQRETSAQKIFHFSFFSRFGPQPYPKCYTNRVCHVAPPGSKIEIRSNKCVVPVLWMPEQLEQLP